MWRERRQLVGGAMASIDRPSSITYLTLSTGNHKLPLIIIKYVIYIYIYINLYNDTYLGMTYKIFLNSYKYLPSVLIHTVCDILAVFGPVEGGKRKGVCGTLQRDVGASSASHHVMGQPQHGGIWVRSGEQ